MNQICTQCGETRNDQYGGEWVGNSYYCEPCTLYNEEKMVATKWITVIAFIGCAVFWGAILAWMI